MAADVGHNASNVLNLIVAWSGARLDQRGPTERYTYGLSRSPILASLFKALLLFAGMGVVATVGLVVNVGTALMFVKGRSTSTSAEPSSTWRRTPV